MRAVSVKDPGQIALERLAAAIGVAPVDIWEAIAWAARFRLREHLVGTMGEQAALTVPPTDKPDSGAAT
jgi:hypothetical protein